MYRMFTANDVSNIFEQLTEIMTELVGLKDVQAAVLSTEDGLSIQRLSPGDPQLAAVAGFMLAAAQQSFAMLGLEVATEVVIRSQDRQMLVCHVFIVSGSKAILTIVFKQRVQYAELVKKTVRKIQQTMEK